MTSPHPMTEEIKRLALTGMSGRAIAAELGIQRTTVNRITMRLRDSGILPKFAPKSASCVVRYRMRVRSGKEFRGSFRQILDHLDPKIGTWLVDQTPDGAVIADTIRAIIVDAYHEEEKRETPARTGACNT